MISVSFKTFPILGVFIQCNRYVWLTQLISSGIDWFIFEEDSVFYDYYWHMGARPYEDGINQVPVWRPELYDLEPRVKPGSDPSLTIQWIFCRNEVWALIG